MKRPLVTLYTVVRGPIYENYAVELLASAQQHFLPDEKVNIVALPGFKGWPDCSLRRYETAISYMHELKGDYIFQIDADCLIEGQVGKEILADGITVTTHPGFPADSPPLLAPYSRDPRSTAYVSAGEGRQYHPGAFVGGPRKDFLNMAGELCELIEQDRRHDVMPEWYDEAYLNRWLIDNPPAKVLDRRYCYWDFWGPHPTDRLIVHLDKTDAEVLERAKGA